MRQVWPEIDSWVEAQRPFALATLVAAEGSSPRAVGSVLAVRPGPKGPAFAGGVSSGCVENELLERAPAVLQEGLVEEHRFGPEAVTPWAVGLTCGGSIRVRLEPYLAFSEDPVVREIARVWHAFIRSDEPGALLSAGKRHLLMMADGSILGERRRWPDAVLERAREGVCGLPADPFLEGEGPEGVFVHYLHPRPRLVLIGAVEIAVEMAALAETLPVRLVVVDPRDLYTRADRFRGKPVEILRQWPGEAVPALQLGPADMLVSLSHDEKIDDPALIAALSGSCGRIGALGSARSHDRRRERLAAEGVPEEQLDRLESPVGLWRSGRDAPAIALSILASWMRGGGEGGCATR